jgi:hypothetical protein
MLAPTRVEVVGGRVGNIASGVIRHNRDVIAYLILLRPALKRSERLTDSYVGRPRNTTIGTIRIE